MIAFISSTRRTSSYLIFLLTCLLISILFASADLSNAGPTAQVIVQATSTTAAADAARAVGAVVTHELDIIHAVAADVTAMQRAALLQQPGVTAVLESPSVMVAGTPDVVFPGLVGARELHAAGITGSGITVAVIDTGIWNTPAIAKRKDGRERILAAYDAIKDKEGKSDDKNGHGTHITSIILSSELNTTFGTANSIAPDARLVSVKALDDTGVGSYADVIRAVDWVVRHKAVYDIRILNLSLSAPPQSYYWDDPLNQAVMRAWQAGIVVVVASGNTGPNPLTIGVPGNVPYVITVGAMSDNYTPDNPTDDILASFSSAGPTVEGFVKPDLVAPGGHIVSLMPKGSIKKTYPQFEVEKNYFMMSGSSQATAVTSGVVALMLQQNPNLTPNDIKCRLMTSANPAVDAEGQLAYSIFQQGAGQLDAVDAVRQTASGCANQGLDIAADLDGRQHFQGRATLDENRNYIIPSIDNSYTWSGGFMWSSGFAWSSNFAWNSGFSWSSGLMWSGTAWSNNPSINPSFNSSSATIQTNTWVPQQ